MRLAALGTSALILSWRYDLYSALDHATRAFLTRDSKVTHFAWAVVDRVPGRQIHLTNPDGSRTFVAIHMHENRLYILDATVPPRAPEPGLFQQSLQFLDNDGKPIRYESVYVVGQPAPKRTQRGIAATEHAALCPRTSAGTNVTLTRSQQFAKKTNVRALVSR